MDNFLTGFYGAITGGAFLALTLFILYFIEQRNKTKNSDKLIKEFKKALAEGRSGKGKITNIRPDSGLEN